MQDFSHTPVMVEPVVTVIDPHPGGVYLDGTMGGGGHAEALLKASAPNGRLFGCDRDHVAVEAAKARLAKFAGRFEVRQGSFSELSNWVQPASCDGALLDLGVSSPQLDEAERGFSFQRDGPLDMRMDTTQRLTAAMLVNETSPQELARLFRDLGGERQSMRLARAIERERQKAPIETTRHLAQLIERVFPRHGSRIHPATRVFQALRLSVNDELGTLAKGLETVWGLLKIGGRLAVISFHSLEVRVVKEFARTRARDYTVEGEVDVPELRRPARPELKWISRKAIVPTPDEINQNPRSRSAQLRAMEKI